MRPGAVRHSLHRSPIPSAEFRGGLFAQNVRELGDKPARALWRTIGAGGRQRDHSVRVTTRKVRVCQKGTEHAQRRPKRTLGVLRDRARSPIPAEVGGPARWKRAL